MPTDGLLLVAVLVLVAVCAVAVAVLITLAPAEEDRSSVVPFDAAVRARQKRVKQMQRRIR